VEPAAARPARLAWRFLLPTMAAIAGTLVTVVPWLAMTLERDQIATVEARLEGDAHEAATVLPWSRGPELDAAAAALGARLQARVTIIAPDGVVLGESERPSATLVNHSDRPEVQAAWRDGAGHSVRWSDTLDRRLLYSAFRQERDGAARIVRIAVPVSSLAEHLVRLRGPVLMGLAVASGLGLLVAWLLSTAMLRRIQRLVRFAAALANGTATPPLGSERRDELGLLEAQLALMARNVTATLAAVRIERERLEAILRGMVEGVLVTDLAGNVVLLNARARELLGLPSDMAPAGRSLVELVRDPGLAELPRELAAGATVVSRDVSLAGGSGPVVQVNGAPLTDEHGTTFGLVLVLHDVTELRRLETVRRDFVANVSHELRTPLTAIKGYAETLLGAAGEDRATALRFLAVIDRHSERLGRLIDDLLILSDLEFGRTPLQRRPIAVGTAIDDALQIVAERAAQRNVDLATEVAADTPPAYVDGDQLRQVLINLVDNAVKYTPEGGHVVVRATRAQLGRRTAAAVAIVDTGIGIPSQDLPRLTERFFRVDKARSRELGGTGLGLAIVKHIVHVHGGTLRIESAVGQGTTVRVVLPAADGRPN
jgi:two-component system phosphate regulon sensor histidine kinase PhoR